jgi:hypothetical protein
MLAINGRSHFWLLIGAVCVLFSLGGVVAFFGIRVESLPQLGVVPVESQPASPVVRIELPYANISLPPGPHREEFEVSCTVCHSSRLVFTQALLPEKKWQEVVHKMVAVYGAPLGPVEEREIVSYLASVHGQQTSE